MAAVIIGVIATTAGRWIIDIACNVVPKQLVRGEFFVTAAILTGIAYVVCNAGLGLSVISSTADRVLRRLRIPADVAGARAGKSGSRGSRRRLAEGEKARKTLGEGLRAEFDPNAE